MWKRHLRRATGAHGGWGRGSVAAQPRHFASAVRATADWDPGSLRALLQQVAHEGKAEEPLLQRLRGGPVAASSTPKDGVGTTEGEAAPEDEAVKFVECGADELVLTAEVCASRRFRDFVLLGALATRLAPEMQKASPDVLRRTGTAFASLGVLNAPLFQALAGAWLETWAAGGEVPKMALLAEVARSFSSQRMRHELFFDRLAAHLATNGAKAATPAEALSILHSHASLRLGTELGDDLWGELEAQASSEGLANMGVGPLSDLCYVLVLSRRADTRQEELCEMLEVLVGPVLGAKEEFWASGAGYALHNRMLLLRSVTRYLYKESYRALPDKVVHAFRKVHRMELPRKIAKPTVSFTRKLSEVLRKMKVGHIVNAESGPFVFDLVERDRKIVYECLHFDRFYAGTVDKVETMCLQERVVKAMGYRVIQVPHWQWNKIKHRRQRSEYLRMSRYYAIKDSRELSPRDEVPEDVALNAFDYMGEYFFKKEQPASSWSWFQPRYDAKRRLPATTAS
mmetsp:Transcript_86349/g.219948  ORF Transcript_86349/g.219948 Transcript_86349/m.219948 type:complete len:513 (-) Transcript_86349:77-1615(-)